MAESHVLSALKQKRAAVSGEIIATERRVGELRAALVHLDGTMRLFAGEDINPEAIPPRLVRSAPVLPAAMPRGDMTRAVLDAMRGQAGGQALPQIVDRVAPGSYSSHGLEDGAMGVEGEDGAIRRRFTERVRNTLYRLRDRSAAENLRDGQTIIWRLID